MKDIHEVLRHKQAKYAQLAKQIELLQQAAEKLRESNLPILLTWAPGDRFFPIEYAERLAAEAGNARIVQIPDAKTFVPLDQPQRLSEEIAKFVSG